jgi:hypothetical protein
MASASCFLGNQLTLEKPYNDLLVLAGLVSELELH